MNHQLPKLIILTVWLVLPTACATKATQIEPPLQASEPGLQTRDVYFAAAPEDLEDSREARQQRPETIAKLEVAFENSTDKGQKASLLFRLAEEQHEFALDRYHEAETTFIKAVDDFRLGETVVEPERDHSDYQKALLKHVNLLRDFIAKFPKDRRHTEAQLQLASSLAKLGNDHCELYFRNAEKLAKDADFRYRVKVARADWLVSQGKWDDAKALYTEVRKAISDDKSPIKAYTFYRLGWVYLNQKEIKKAEVSFKLAYLAYTSEFQRRFDLQDEAALKLADIWARQNNWSEAEKFAKEQERPSILADYREFFVQELKRKGNFDQVIKMRNDEIAQKPTANKVADLRLDIAQAYVALNNLSGLDAQLEQLQLMTSAEDNVWFEEHEDDPVLIGRANRIAALLPLASGLKLARWGELESDPKKKAAYLNGAVQLLLREQPKIEDPTRKASVHLTLIQALTALNRKQEVLTQLDGLMKLGPDAGVAMADIAFERLSILNELDENAQYPALPERGAVKKPIPLPPFKQRFALAAKEYLKIVPDAENKVILDYKVADDLFSYGHYPQALQLMEKLAKEFPRSEQGQAAMQILVSMAGQNNQYDEVIRLSTNFLNNRRVKGKTIRDFLKESLDWAKSQREIVGH